jgi:hypothetical protein
MISINLAGLFHTLAHLTSYTFVTILVFSVALMGASFVYGFIDALIRDFMETIFNPYED